MCVRVPVVCVAESEKSARAPETVKVEAKSVFVMALLEISNTLPEIVGDVTAVE